MKDEQLRKTIVEAVGRDEQAPEFDEVWRAAEARNLRNRSRNRIVAVTAAAVAALVVAVLPDPEKESETMIEMNDLLGSTSWQAPSDVLLPDYRTDIYQDMPDLIEYGNAAEEAFL